MRHVAVLVTSSYPRFPGDNTGSFMEPIAQGLAARGHDVHVVAPWHPRITRTDRDGGVRYHFYRYAPEWFPQTFGYAGALKADVHLRLSAVLATPLAVAAGIRTARRVARAVGATVLHGHWVVPGGFMVRMAGLAPLPVVISLHGSDVYVAERHAPVGAAARWAFRGAAWVTACSADLRDRAVALGANAARCDVLPYGVDARRFAPAPEARVACRAQLGVDPSTPIVFTAGRLVRKKGLEYLVDGTVPLARRWPSLRVVIAGGGDLEDELRARARHAGVAGHVVFLGPISQADMPRWLAAADVVAVPSVRDDAGNVDGLPNVVMETLASGTPLVATPAGGIASVVEDGRTGRLVPERDAEALARAIGSVLADPASARDLGRAARQLVNDRYTWEHVAERFEHIFDLVASRRTARPGSEA